LAEDVVSVERDIGANGEIVTQKPSVSDGRDIILSVSRNLGDIDVWPKESGTLVLVVTSGPESLLDVDICNESVLP